MIDGEALSYENSIIWECFPGNIEVFVDDSLFTANKTFSYRLTPEIERNRMLVAVVDKIWAEFDSNTNDKLEKEETRTFLKKAFENLPLHNHFDESKFDETFVAIDKNGNGTIEKNEMVLFMKSILKQQREY